MLWEDSFVLMIQLLFQTPVGAGLAARAQIQHALSLAVPLGVIFEKIFFHQARITKMPQKALS